jgi:hypothetical protein
MSPSGKKKENCLTVKQLNTANKNIFIASRTSMSTKTKYNCTLSSCTPVRFCKKKTVTSKNFYLNFLTSHQNLAKNLTSFTLTPGVLITERL